MHGSRPVSAPYATDVYHSGEWTYAFALPQLPSGNSGTANLYKTIDGTVQLANVDGNTVSWPTNPNSPWIFRDGQAVQFTPDQNAPAAATGSWSIGPGTITMDITDNGLFSDGFALSWAMTCANDVIQGQVAAVPEPSTWAMLLIGFAGLGFAGHRRRLRPAPALARI